MTIPPNVPIEGIQLGNVNMAGQRVDTLTEGSRPAGPHAVRWHGLDGQGRRLASGVYLLRFQAGSRWETRKVVAAR